MTTFESTLKLSGVELKDLEIKKNEKDLNEWKALRDLFRQFIVDFCPVNNIHRNKLKI